MTIAPDLVAQILRLHTVEKWRVGTIARQLHVHRDTVRRVLAGNNAPVHRSPLRASRIDPYRLFILETLGKFPALTAARLHAMVGVRGYVGAESHFRLLIAGMRPRPPAEAYLRLRTLPGAHSPGSKSSLRKAHWRRRRRVGGEGGDVAWHRYQCRPRLAQANPRGSPRGDHATAAVHPDSSAAAS